MQISALATTLQSRVAYVALELGRLLFVKQVHCVAVEVLGGVSSLPTLLIVMCGFRARVCK